MLRKLDHYKTRFLEHSKSITFAQRKRNEIQTQIKTCVELNPKYGPQNYKFLEEIAELVIKARRALTNTYAVRYYLEGRKKQEFFDFIQGDLESSLEKLNKRNEEEWEQYLEVDGFACNG